MKLKITIDQSDRESAPDIRIFTQDIRTLVRAWLTLTQFIISAYGVKGRDLAKMLSQSEKLSIAHSRNEHFLDRACNF